MFRALYPFQKTHPSSLTFAEKELFLQLPGASSDKNWYYVISKAGVAGFVPRNYMKPEDVTDEELLQRLDEVRVKVKMATMIPDRERGEVLAKVDMAKRNITTKVTVLQVELATSSGSITAAPATSILNPASSSKATGCKKRAAPLPPAVQSSTAPGTKPADPMPEAPAPCRRRSVADPSEEQLRCDGRELLERVRDKTGLSHKTSLATVQMVLTFLMDRYQHLDRNVPALLSELERPCASDRAKVAVEQEDELLRSADAVSMLCILEELCQRKDDVQQRNWMLHTDQHILNDLLQRLYNGLQNSERKVSLVVVARFKYFYVHSLIDYFQMETRWLLREKLIDVFMVMCSLDHLVIGLMLSSVLPLELAQEIHQHTSRVDRLRQCGLLLTIIFSLGEPMPVHYFAQLGEAFLDSLLDMIENPPSREHDREVADVFMGLVLSYNLQFKEKQCDSNLVVQSLCRRGSAKAFTEQLLLLLNREDDPTDLVSSWAVHFPDDDLLWLSYSKEQEKGKQMNATLKMIMDIFRDRRCHQLFYTNDLFVLLDIIVRQLSDLSYEDDKRKWYVELCHLVLLKTNYNDHLHRFRDFERCFIRILEEDDQVSASQKAVVTSICREILAFNSII